MFPIPPSGSSLGERQKGEGTSIRKRFADGRKRVTGVRNGG